MTLGEILLEQALKTSGKDNAVSGKAWQKPPEMEKKVVGTGNQKVSLARKQSLHWMYKLPRSRWLGVASLTRKLTFSRSNRKPWKAIEFWAKAWNNLILFSNLLIDDITLLLIWSILNHSLVTPSFMFFWKQTKPWGKYSLWGIKSLGQFKSLFSNL